MMIELDQKFFEVTENTDLRATGSTAILAVVSPPQQPKSCWGFSKKKAPQYQIDVAHVGDSRCVLYRRNQGKAEQITRDHKPDNPQEHERVKKAGGLIMDGRVDGKLAVTRSIGDWPMKNNPEVLPERQKVIPVPDIEQRFAQEGDFLLIACDGIFEKLETDKVMEILRESLDEKMDPCAALVKLLDASQMAGSTDNMTAILLVFQDGTDYHAANPEFDVGKLFVEDRYVLYLLLWVLIFVM
jgi:serine/threonine protein phosphatase PrpC